MEHRSASVASRPTTTTEIDPRQASTKSNPCSCGRASTTSKPSPFGRGAGVRVRTCETSCATAMNLHCAEPYPHPALRATFSRREKEVVQSRIGTVIRRVAPSLLGSRVLRSPSNPALGIVPLRRSNRRELPLAVRKRQLSPRGEKGKLVELRFAENKSRPFLLLVRRAIGLRLVPETARAIAERP
jgi:hypothetical protein